MLSELEKMKAVTATSVDPLQKRVGDDLTDLCKMAGYSLMVNINLYSIHHNAKSVANLLAVPHDTANSVVQFPISNMKEEDENFYVAVVTYSGGNPTSAYLFPGHEFKRPGMFSIFGRNNKTGMASVKMGKVDKLKQYSFANVAKQIVADA